MRILLESVLLMYFCIVDILPSELTLQDLSLTEGKINLNVHQACQTHGLWVANLICSMYTFTKIIIDNKLLPCGELVLFSLLCSC